MKGQGFGLRTMIIILLALGFFLLLMLYGNVVGEKLDIVLEDVTKVFMVLKG